MNIQRIVRLVTTGVGALFLVPIITLNVEKLAQQQHWDGFLASIWSPTVAELSQLAQNGWFLFFAGLVGGVAISLWISELLSRKAAHQSYTETRIRLERDPSAPTNFRERSKSNIYGWQQVYSLIDQNGLTILRHDCFFFVFEKATSYDRPTIDSFGTPLPAHNWFAMTDRAAVVQFTSEIKAGSFEVYFPPPRV